MDGNRMKDLADLAENRLKEMPPITFLDLVSWGASAAMVFGGIVPFIPQYLDIRRTQNTEGFSTHVCLVLLVANTLRILFWFGHPFELPLLAQSIIMIFTMMVLLQLCTQVSLLHAVSTAKRHITEPCNGSEHVDVDMGVSEHSPAPHREGQEVRVRHIHSDPLSRSGEAQDVGVVRHSPTRTILDLDYRYFWKWTRFIDYVFFMVAFTAVGGVLTHLLSSNSAYVETIGFLAVFTEAMLGSPQFYHNFRNKSTHGMSVKMVMFWLSGDLFKTGYFLVNEAPVQFWICGILQVSIDIAILTQVVYYGGRPPAKLGKVSAPTGHIS